MITDGRWQQREPLCFQATIFEWTQSVHLPVYPYKVIRWGCVGSNTVTVTCRADYCTSLAPFWVVRYASPPLPAAIPLPWLPVPALECFCSILNRLIEQCSRERAACQSQLKTQKQKIKKAHGWTPALIKKNFFLKVLESCAGGGGCYNADGKYLFSYPAYRTHTQTHTDTRTQIDRPQW